MGRVTTRRRIQRLSGAGVRTRPDTLAVEEPLEIRIDGAPFVVTMRTPGHDVELATGFLLSEGVITRGAEVRAAIHCGGPGSGGDQNTYNVDRKSTRLNSSHVAISYAVFCLKKKSRAIKKVATTLRERLR